MEDLVQVRKVMGEAITSVAVLARSKSLVANDHWYALTGVNAADWNMALVFDNNPAVLTSVLDEINRVDVPTYVLLAGAGTDLGAAFPDGWVHAGSYPFMRTDAPFNDGHIDPRVRRAGPDDGEAINLLIAQAFGLDSEVSRELIQAVADQRTAMTAWILEDNGVALSTVMTARSGDVVSVWCMATTPAAYRKGYGKALLSTVLTLAEREGATIGLLGATEAGFPLYEALGWRTVEDWAVYADVSSATH